MMSDDRIINENIREYARRLGHAIPIAATIFFIGSLPKVAGLAGPLPWVFIFVFFYLGIGVAAHRAGLVSIPRLGPKPINKEQVRDNLHRDHIVLGAASGAIWSVLVFGAYFSFILYAKIGISSVSLAVFLSSYIVAPITISIFFIAYRETEQAGIKDSHEAMATANKRSFALFIICTAVLAAFLPQDDIREAATLMGIVEPLKEEPVAPVRPFDE